MERYGEKLITKKLLDIIQPKKLKSLIMDEIEYKGKQSVQTRNALFKLVKRHATNLSFYYDAGLSASSGLSSAVKECFKLQDRNPMLQV